jgi:hypothetical protein
LVAWINLQVGKFCQSGLQVINILVECFYNKGGVWYYAGTYEAIRLDDLSVEEWAQLPAEVDYPKKDLSLF